LKKGGGPATAQGFLLAGPLVLTRKRHRPEEKKKSFCFLVFSKKEVFLTETAGFRSFKIL